MHLISIALVAAASAIFAAGATPAAASQIAPGMSTDSILTGIADLVVSGGSLAWAGEDETFASVDPGLLDTNGDDLLAAHAAPEPPAIVLAGMAIGGVFCGRSLLRKKKVARDANEESRT